MENGKVEVNAKTGMIGSAAQPRLRILAKLALIMGEVGTLSKDKTNEFQKYRYLSESAIKAAVQPLLVRHGVLFTVSLEGSTTRRVESKGGTQNLTEVRLGYSFTDCESGESVTGYMDGCGQDSGDKGLYKAITGAIKYVMTSTFLIPTNDDPEAERAAAPAAKASDRPPFGRGSDEEMDSIDLI